MKQMIQNQERELKNKKQQDAEEKRLKMRQDLIQKILAENERRIQVEQEVARLEQEELQLIQKL